MAGRASRIWSLKMLSILLTSLVLLLYHVIHYFGDFFEFRALELTHHMLQSRFLNQSSQFEVVLGACIQIRGGISSLLLELGSPDADIRVLLASLFVLFLVVHHS